MPTQQLANDAKNRIQIWNKKGILTSDAFNSMDTEGIQISFPKNEFQVVR